jgi:hypothetical protein
VRLLLRKSMKRSWPDSVHQSLNQGGDTEAKVFPYTVNVDVHMWCSSLLGVFARSIFLWPWLILRYTHMSRVTHAHLTIDRSIDRTSSILTSIRMHQPPAVLWLGWGWSWRRPINQSRLVANLHVNLRPGSLPALAWHTYSGYSKAVCTTLRASSVTSP